MKKLIYFLVILLSITGCQKQKLLGPYSVIVGFNNKNIQIKEIDFVSISNKDTVAVSKVYAPKENFTKDLDNKFMPGNKLVITIQFYTNRPTNLDYPSGALILCVNSSYISSVQYSLYSPYVNRLYFKFVLSYPL